MSDEALTDTQHLTDLGNSARLVAAHGRDLKRCAVYPGDGWLTWTGVKWEPDTTLGIMRYAAKVPGMIEADAVIHETVASLETDAAKKADATEQAKQTRAWARRSESAERQRALVSLARADPRIVVRENQLDADRCLLNTPIGTVDLRLGIMREHRRDDFITRCTGCPPASHGKNSKGTPLWDAFLLRAMGGDPDMVAYLQRAVGYSLVGTTQEQVFFISHGMGANGKSVFLGTIMRALGDYAKATPASTFMSKKDASIPNDLAALTGVRFVSASETEEGKLLDESSVKAVTGGDTISARFLNREWFEYVPQFTLWLATNHRPNIRGTDNGIWRRIRLIPWEVRIPDEEQDKGLQERLWQEEAPGILQWAIDGCMAWQEMGLATPDPVKTATQEYRSDMDVMADFLAECTEAGTWYNVSNSDIYRAFCDWSESMGERARAHRWFTRAMKDRGFKQVPGHTGKRWDGLQLLPGVNVSKSRPYLHAVD